MALTEEIKVAREDVEELESVATSDTYLARLAAENPRDVRLVGWRVLAVVFVAIALLGVAALVDPVATLPAALRRPLAGLFFTASSGAALASLFVRQLAVERARSSPLLEEEQQAMQRLAGLRLRQRQKSASEQHRKPIS